MFGKIDGNQRVLEVFLVVITIALAVLLNAAASHKMVVLNLFFLPVVIGGFFLGHYRAGVLALFCVIAASVAVGIDLPGFALYSSPLVITLAVVLWGAVLCLTALLVGTLSDERAAKIVELHEAYVGVVEVLSTYLQSANPRLKVRSTRVADLSQQVAKRLKLSPKETDDVRVAALLHDMENIEITARVIQKAVSNIQTDQVRSEQHTFHGTDLVRSLGSVLSGAIPLLLGQEDVIQHHPPAEKTSRTSKIPLGSRIIRAVRAYDALAEDAWGEGATSPEEAIDELRRDSHVDYGRAVLDALEHTIQQAAKVGTKELQPIS